MTKMNKLFSTTLALVMVANMLALPVHATETNKKAVASSNGAAVSCKKTVIKLKKTKKTLRPYQNYKIKATIKNKKGNTTYKSSNTKVAKVDKNGWVTAKKSGKAKITVKNNKVKKKITINVKKSYKIVRQIKNKSINFKFKQFVKTMTLNVGQQHKYVEKDYGDKYYMFEDFFGNLSYDTAYIQNLFCYFEYDKEMSRYQYKIYLNKSAIKSVKSSNTNVLTVAKSGHIIAKNKGTATITLKLIDRTIKVKVNVIKKKTTTYKGKTSLAVYSNQELYKEFEKEFYNHLIKGERPKYKYVTCYYNIIEGESDWDEQPKTYQYYLYKKACKSFRNGKNVFACITEIFDYINTVALYNDYGNIRNAVVVKIGFDDPDNYSYYKKNYKLAQGIFDKMNINQCATDYEKLKVLQDWWKEYATYDGGGDITDVLSGTGGACVEFADATVYLLTFLRIPCLSVGADGCHMYNMVYLSGKWYYLDFGWRYLCLGSNDIASNDINHQTNYILGEEYIKYNISKTAYTE